MAPSAIFGGLSTPNGNPQIILAAPAWPLNPLAGQMETEGFMSVDRLNEPRF